MKKLAIFWGLCLLGLQALDVHAQATKASERITIRIASHQSSQSPHHWVLTEFKKRLETASKGSIEVKVFSDGQLGNARENLEGVQLGTVEMCLVDTGQATNLVPDYGLLTLPFIYRNYDHLNAVLKSDVVKKMDAKMVATQGLRPLGWYPDGLRVFITKDAKKTLADFKGTPLRSMESPVVVDTIKSLGASATPIAWNDVYMSLQTNVVAGMESAPSSILAMKFYEVNKNITVTEHINLGVTVIMGEKFFAKLPKEAQTSVIQVMSSVVEDQKARTVKQQEDALKSMESKGVKIYSIDKAPLVEAVKPLWTKYAAKVPDGENIVKAIVAVK